MNRRNFLQNAGAFALGSTLAALPNALGAAPVDAAAKPARKRVLRAAQFTDLHVLAKTPDGTQDSAAGVAAALRHAQNQTDKPEVLLFTGDMVMDSLKCSKADAIAQWEVWERVFKAEVKTPYRLTIGNHDIWGWGLHNQPEIERDPHYGKGLMMERLGIKERYYSYDQADWHFVVLDSMQPGPGNKHAYIARLDDEQFAWLARDLAAVPATTPVAIISHIPIFSACVLFDGDNEAEGSWMMSAAWMHIDARRIKDLFKKHPNVKVCFSGHVHLVDEVTYLGVRYLCNGAVSGGWWKGPYQEFAGAYALIDFYDDGSVENQLVFGPWTT